MLGFLIWFGFTALILLIMFMYGEARRDQGYREAIEEMVRIRNEN